MSLPNEIPGSILQFGTKKVSWERKVTQIRNKYIYPCTLKKLWAMSNPLTKTIETIPRYAGGPE